ncbi:MAG TPA: sensor domain-containing diguanylate cyclase [Solirubrobacteraceae bacterium]|nr:sensor domain-containing diguanylate cyclase [Solirubrobacteraceae bacterium]
MSADETQRRDHAISRLGVLERAADPGLTAVCRLAAYVTGADNAAIHIIDSRTQHRVAAERAPLGDHPRQDAMCRLVVDGNQRIICPDATADARFDDSSFTRGPDPVRFYASVPLRMSDGVVIGSVCAFDSARRELDRRQLALLEDLAEQASAQIELAQVAGELGDLASRDPLTGAVNRRVLADRLGQAFGRQLRTGGQTLLAMVDVDDFKSFNDSYGHAAGDEILVTVARRLSRTLRGHDTVARVGGDEFVVLAETGGDATAARRLADDLQAALAEPFEITGCDRRVGVTVGCILARPGEDVRTALARADAAMYAGKAGPATR